MWSSDRRTICGHATAASSSTKPIQLFLRIKLTEEKACSCLLGSWVSGFGKLEKDLCAWKSDFGSFGTLEVEEKVKIEVFRVERESTKMQDVRLLAEACWRLLF
ncbi:uncharacterized protein [Arachis hypogaea]|uniref:uncharacterized protein isoform X2 n=1 Tax=Arachis hypogaea TaxID=3818 RepID=UPI000DEC9114|nr:uncharacterized protein LOC112718268 [Arachis hypogaea]QHO16299.1 uncharacterized protein DS421_10g302430 [Arachis hypogaea]